MSFTIGLKRYFKNSTAKFLFKLFLIIFIVSSFLSIFYNVISSIFPSLIDIIPEIQMYIGVIMVILLIGIVFFEFVSK